MPELAKAYVQIIPSAEGIKGNLTKIMDGEADSAGKSAGGKFGSAFGSVAKAGLAAVGAASGALAAFAGTAVKTGLTFDSTMSKVAAISGATGEDFDALREKAQYMGATTKFSATESGEALTYMAMAGWKTEDMLSGLEGIMNLAAASGEDLATTSDIVTDALTAFGLAAEDSNRFADVLAAASSNANTNVALMGETFKYVAPAAGALGYSIEDTATAIGLMANAGVKGSMAGTALRSILTRLAKPTKESQAAMDALGLSLIDNEGNMKSFGDIMLDIRDGFKNKLVIPAEEVERILLDLNDALEAGELSQKEYDNALDMLMNRAYGAEGALMAQYAAMLGGQEAMSGLLAIVNASDEDFEKLTTAIYGSEGAAKQMADTMQDNLLGDITIFKSALEGAKIAVSDELTPSLRELVQFGTDGISKLTMAFKDDGVKGAMEAFGSILSEGLAMLTAGLPDVINAGMELLQALMQGISDNVDLLAETAVTVAVQLVTFLLDNLPLIIRTGLDILTSLAQGIADNLEELIPTVVDVVLEIVDTLTDPQTLGNLIDAALAIIIALAEGIVASIPELLKRAPEIITNLVTTLVENLPKIFDAGADILLEIIEGILFALPDLIAAIPTLIMAVVTGLANGVKDLFGAGEKILQDVKDGFWEKLDGAKDWGKDLISNFVSGITQKWEDLKASVRGVAQTVKDLLGFSEPKEGPLANFHTFAPDMMMLFAKGIRDNEYLVEDQLKKSLDFSEALENTWEPDRLSSAVRGAGAYRFGGAPGTASGESGRIDAAALAQAVASALEGCGVYMDGHAVGRLVTRVQANTARAYG